MYLRSDVCKPISFKKCNCKVNLTYTDGTDTKGNKEKYKLHIFINYYWILEKTA